MITEFLNNMDLSATEVLRGDVVIVEKDAIPRESTEIYIEAQKWLRINNICAIFIDMVDSSQIDFETYNKTSAGIYETFTGNMVRVMEAFDAAYIDIKGDGVFALFDGPKAYAKGFIAATTFRTFVEWHLERRISRKTNGKVSVATRSGISYGDTIVKRVGTRKSNNEVWAYQRVNQAAKLAGIASENHIAASRLAYENLVKIDWIEKSCGCYDDSETGRRYNGIRMDLWRRIEEGRLVPPLVSEAYELVLSHSEYDG